MLFFDVSVGDFVAAPSWNPSDALWTEETIALDVETFSPTGSWKGVEHHNGCLRLLQVYLPSKKFSLVLDWLNLSVSDCHFIERLKIALEKGIEVIAHNAKYEYRWIKQHLGVSIKRLRCSMVANQMLDAGLFQSLSKAYGGKPNSLRVVALRRLGYEPPKDEQDSDWGIPELSASQLKYAALDPFICYACWVAMLPRLKRLGVAFEAEMVGVKAFAEIEFNGMPADRDYLEDYIRRYTEVVDRLHSQLVGIFKDAFKDAPQLIAIFPESQQKKRQRDTDLETKKRAIASAPAPMEFNFKTPRNQKRLQSVIGACYTPELPDGFYIDILRKYLVGEETRKFLLTKAQQKSYQVWLDCRQWARENPPLGDDNSPVININSPKQLKPFLEHLLGVKLPSTNSLDLAPYVGNSFVKTLLEYRHILVLLQYLEAYLKAYRDGAVFGHFSCLATSGIGRSDSSSPNLQNVPKFSAICKKYGLPPVREVFRLPEWELLLYCLGLLDAAGSHLQILRDLSKDPNLMKALKDNIKVHFLTCQAILNIYGKVASIPEIIAANAKDAVGALHDDMVKIYPQAKTVVYAFINLAGAATLFDTFKEYGENVPINTCNDLLKACRVGYKGAWDFIQENLKKASANINTLYDTPQHFAPVATYMEACGIPISPLVGKPHWLGQFSTNRASDGRVVNIELGKKKTVCGVENFLDGARVTAMQWLSVEASAMKLTLGTLAAWGQANPQYGFKLRGFAHDEVIFTCLAEHKDIVGAKVYDTMRDCFRRVCENFAPEDSEFKGWVTTWNDK